MHFTRCLRKSHPTEATDQLTSAYQKAEAHLCGWVGRTLARSSNSDWSGGRSRRGPCLIEASSSLANRGSLNYHRGAAQEADLLPLHDSLHWTMAGLPAGSVEGNVMWTVGVRQSKAAEPDREGESEQIWQSSPSGG